MFQKLGNMSCDEHFGLRLFNVLPDTIIDGFLTKIDRRIYLKFALSGLGACYLQR